jgi:hypothetical protein
VYPNYHGKLLRRDSGQQIYIVLGFLLGSINILKKLAGAEDDNFQSRIRIAGFLPPKPSSQNRKLEYLYLEE